MIHFTRSPIDTAPTTVSSGKTGRCRGRCLVMMAMHPSTVCRGPTINDRPCHDFADTRLLRGVPDQDHFSRVVALGNNSHQPALGNHQERAPTPCFASFSIAASTHGSGSTHKTRSSPVEKHLNGVGKFHRLLAYLPLRGSQTGAPFASRKVRVSVPFTISLARITADSSRFTLEPVNEI